MIADEDTFPNESEFYRLNKDAVLRHRNQVIEECALVAQEFRTHAPGTAWIMDEIAAAIRALKDKP